MSRHHRFSLVIALCLVVVAVWPLGEAAGQGTSASITGRVVDDEGAPLPGANVQLVGTTFGAATDTTGRFEISGLAQGNYTVSASFIGYDAQTREIELDAGSTVTLQFQLSSDAFSLAEIAVTANRRETSLDKVGSSISVVNGAEIERKQFTGLDEPLREVPGLVVSRTGSEGGKTFIRMRGFTNKHTLILIDGIRVTNPTQFSNEFSIDDLLLDGVERVEVLRGPQSGIYGSDAMAGVINVITKEGRGTPRATAFIEGGSFTTLYGGGNVNGQVGRFDFNINGTIRDTESISVASRPPDNDESDAYQNISFLGNAGYTALKEVGALDRLQVRFLGRYTTSEAETDADFGEPPFFFFQDSNHVNDSQESLMSGRVIASLFSGRFQNEVTASRFASTSKTTLDGTSTFDATGHVTNFRYQGTIRQPLSAPLTGSTLTFGAERSTEKGTFDVAPSINRLQENDLTTDGLFSHLRVTIADRLHVNAAGRLEDHERFGGVETYRLSTSWEIPMESAIRVTKLRSSIGTGFEAPSLRQLFSESDTFRGNPNLDPERSRMWDVGLHFAVGANRLTGSVTYYDGWANEGIFSIFDPEEQISVATNIDSRIEMRGVETEALIRPLPRVTLQTRYTWAESIIVDSDQQLFERPNHMVSAFANVQPTSRLSVGARVHYRGEQFASFPSDFKMDSSTRVDLLVDYNVSEELRVYARMENATDAEYEERLGTSTPGRAFYIGVRAKLPAW